MVITPEDSGKRPSETTLNVTGWVALLVVEVQVTETYLSLGVVPSQLSPSAALMRTCEDDPFTVMVQSSA
ncbi:hypothetical protein JOD43_002864 [Pullulanibacillus pueri]|uniref:Uncharacterized protein n=1 Tax=Pullulanibacillus pueri TaxID=1437324 RepID=A0A8J3ELX0_9BACL|nr:hypothetical protein [Pullulanibacillus pueri]GGH82788.1 hypothetical protein GCM10007096_22690 [Pullulanibacillus pueri]